MIDSFNILSLSLPGVAVTYQGEELGMTNNMDISYVETVDPSGMKAHIDVQPHFLLILFYRL